MKLPNHIAIIMDGNGRWGLKKYNSRLLGHEHGIKNIKPLVNFFLKKKIKNLTLYALSFDNLKKRSKKEISNLFDILQKYLIKNEEYFTYNKICLNFIGEKQNIPKKIKGLINKFNKKKLKKINLRLNIAFNYSSRKEIIYSVKKIYKKTNKINENSLSKNLFTHKSGDPSILIRTGGFQRLSDFLLWQLSYTELFFPKKLWPDFKIKDLKKILIDFNKVKRNFGSC